MTSHIWQLTVACAAALLLSASPVAASDTEELDPTDDAAESFSSSSPRDPTVTELASGFNGPLRVAFGPHGSFLVAEAFSGQLTQVSATGEKTTLVNAPGQEITGVSHARGTTYYFNNDPGSGPEGPTELLPARLMALSPDGSSRTVADLSEFEAAHNPDADTVYGVRDADPSCLAQAPELQSRGELYSHPYASEPIRNGVLVADAGANALLKVSNSGQISLVKALPPEPVVITDAVVAQAAAEGVTVPSCMLGLTYYAQAVPTDVDVRGNWAYYTVLPGVPGENFSQGKLYRTQLRTGATELVMAGLAAPTGLAVGRHGTLYVAELQGPGISVVGDGTLTEILSAPQPADVAARGRTLAVVFNALTPGGGTLTIMRR